MGKIEDFSLGEEQHDNYFSYHEDTANQFVSDYNPWCAYGGEEDSHDYGRQHPRTVMATIWMTWDFVRAFLVTGLACLGKNQQLPGQ